MAKQLWSQFQFIDYLNVKENEIRELPEGVSISTMCGKCRLDTKLYLDDIKQYLPLSSDDILTVKVNRDKLRTLIPPKIKKRRTKKKKSIKSNPFYNQITVVVRVFEGECTNLNDEKKINLKLFKNGSIQISGLKKLEYANRALNKLVYRLSQIKAKLNDSKIEEIEFVEDTNSLGIFDFSIYMINSNYRVNMQIDRSKLFQLLLKKKIKTSYEKCIRACVIVKYTPKKMNEEEKEVSIFIFEKGNIIITGARNLSHIVDSYEYINNILLEHIEDVIKTDDDIEGELILKLYDNILKDNNHKLNPLHI